MCFGEEWRCECGCGRGWEEDEEMCERVGEEGEWEEEELRELACVEWSGVEWNGVE